MNKEFQSYLLIAINNKSRENNKGKLCMQIKKKKSVCNYTSKTDRHDITEILLLLKVALSTIDLNLNQT
jgi:hypothetical protein